MNLTVLLVFFPLALWLVAGASVIIRLLNYLDTRIRLEGWEVELSVRAESLRQFGNEDSAGMSPQSQNSKATEATDSAKSKSKRLQTAGANR